ncbi:MAG: hypothetical protein H0V78_10230 [Burkholderiales bacterium]|nr:hypothetical protein [Burkholderiales bacterium]
MLSDDMFASGGSVRFNKSGKKQLAIVTTRDPWQAELLAFVAGKGVRGLVRIPLQEVDCRSLRTAFERFLSERTLRLRELISERTADEEMQEKICAALFPRLNQSG